MHVFRFYKWRIVSYVMKQPISCHLELLGKINNRRLMLVRHIIIWKSWYQEIGPTAIEVSQIKILFSVNPKSFVHRLIKVYII